MKGPSRAFLTGRRLVDRFLASLSRLRVQPDHDDATEYDDRLTAATGNPSPPPPP